MNKRLFLVALCVFLIFTFSFGQQWENWDSNTYYSRITNQSSEDYQQSIFYPLARALYVPFGYHVVVLFPLFTLFISVFALFKLFQEFELNVFLIPVFFLQYWAWSFLFYLMRDALLFCFASVYAYYFFKTLKRYDAHFLKLFVLAILATITTSFGVVFIFLTYLLLLYKRIPAFPVILVDLEAGLRNLVPFNPLNNVNPVTWVSVVAFVFVSDWFFLLFIALHFLTANAIVNIGFSVMEAYRYTFSLTIFNWFFLCLAFKRIHGKICWELSE